MPGPTGRPSFVGRRQELGILLTKLEDARAGAGGVVLLAGEPGIGKTRTAEELAAAASAGGVRVLWGRCWEGEGAPAYWPWVQILRALVRESEPSALLAAIGAAAADIVQVVPELGVLAPDLPPPPALEPAQARFRLFEGVATLLMSVAGWPDGRAPLVLILDDLHWADAPSLLLLHFLAREIRGAPLLIVATYRDLEVGRQDPLARTLADLARLEHVQRVPLRGLPAPDAARLIAATAGTELPTAVTDAVAALAEGNPFFLAETVRLLASEGRLDDTHPATAAALNVGVSQGVRDVIGRRLDRLSPECSRMLGVAAVIGRDFRSNLLREVTTLPPEPLLSTLEEAEAARIIAAVLGAPGQYRFTHALIRETLYEELSTARLVALHQQVGEALRGFYAQAAESHLAELAHHFLQAAPGGDVEPAVEYARAAGDRALNLLAYEEAAGHYQRALLATDLAPSREEWRRCELLLALGDARMRAGDTPAAHAAFVEAADIARTLARGEARPEGRTAAALLAGAALGYGGAGVQTGLVDERLIGLLEEALTALTDGPDAEGNRGIEDDRGIEDGRGLGAEPRPEGVGEPHGFPNSKDVLRVRLLARLAMELYWSDARDRRIALSGEAVKLGRQAGDASALAFAVSARHLAFWEPENVQERLAIGAEHLRAAESAGDRQALLEGHARRIPDLLQIGDIGAVEQAIERHARLAAELRQPVYRWEALRFQALLAYLHGRFDEMEQIAREALALAERAQIGGADVLFVSHLQFLRREQGRYAEIETSAKEITARYAFLRDSWGVTLANLYAQTGRTAEAQREIDAMAAAQFDVVGDYLYTLGLMALLAEAIAAVGDASSAAILYRRLEPYAGHHIVNAAAPNFYGAADHYLGMLAATMSRWDDAIALFEPALAMNTRTSVPSHIAATRVEYARALLNADRDSRSADRQTAHELLDAALGIAQELGMLRLLDQIEQLRKSRPPIPTRGAVSDSRESALPAGLTPREAEVLRLLAGGMSNQEIAEALVVTINTVERHLVSVYGKLGVRGRSAATAYAHRHGLT